MRKFFNSLFTNPSLKKLQICQKHLDRNRSGETVISLKQAVAYKSDHCQSCDLHMCLVCSQSHVSSHCFVQTSTWKDMGQGVLRNLNYGELVKLEVEKLRCICGKGVGPGAAFCAACGMFSCSEACHQRWVELGKCTFMDNFYSAPEGFTMRSILYENIKNIQNSKIKQWAIANRSSTTMLCAYAMGQTPYIYLQRGHRIYGTPNPQVIDLLQTTTRNLDYYIHFERACDCQCDGCTPRPVHSATNCQPSCKNFDHQFMKYHAMQPQHYKQCGCSCEFCSSGIVFSTHRFIDCMMFCKRSKYWMQDSQNIF